MCAKDRPVPETLEAIAANLNAPARGERFTRVDEPSTFDGCLNRTEQPFVEMRVHLGAKIDAIGTKLDRIYDELVAMREEAKRNADE